jgi:K+/H+ antiporter YhaU regulatory subunit KhtT
MSLPVYQTIALDLARRIINQEFSVGEKISGRTLLAGQYSVSPETIRKAIFLLKDANIVSVSQGKELQIISSEQAFLFLTHQQEIASTYSLKQELELLLQEKEDIDLRFHKITNEIMHYSDRLKNINPFNPMEIELSPQSGLIGKSLQELNFRKKTGCLIIAIRRKTQVFIAPEPAERLEELDRIVIIGSPESMQNIKTFF